LVLARCSLYLHVLSRTSLRATSQTARSRRFPIGDRMLLASMLASCLAPRFAAAEVQMPRKNWLRALRSTLTMSFDC
jgi:hypothetical protein